MHRTGYAGQSGIHVGYAGVLRRKQLIFLAHWRGAGHFRAVGARRRNALAYYWRKIFNMYNIGARREPITSRRFLRPYFKTCMMLTQLSTVKNKTLHLLTCL